MKQVIKVGLLILALFLMLTACDDDDSSNSNSKVQIKGAVSVEEPVEKADITVYDSDDKQIASYFEESYSNGTFIISVNPSDIEGGFRLEANRGYLSKSNQPFHETLSANVEYMKGESGPFVHIGYVSTILDEYLKNNPETGFEAAEAAIADLLDIPETQKLNADLHFIKDDFSPVQFSEEAEAYGGVRQLITDLLYELKQNSEAEHSFRSAPVAHSFKTEVGKTFISGLAKGIGGKVGGEAAGWVLNSIFGGGDDPQEPDSATKKDIEQLSGQIHALEESIERNKQKISDALENLFTKGNEEAYISLIQGIRQSISAMKDYRLSFYTLTAQINSDSDEWKDIAKGLRDDLNLHEIRSALIAIQDTMTGDAGQPHAALRIWRDIVLANTDMNSKRPEENLFSQFQYFYGLQASILNLYLEKAHAEGNISDCEVTEDLYMNKMQEQSKIFLDSVEALLGYMYKIDWSHGLPQPIGNLYSGDWKTEKIWEVQPASHRTSPTFAKADEIVASAQGYENSYTVRIATVYRPLSELKERPQYNVPVINIDTGVEFDPLYSRNNWVDDQVGITGIDMKTTRWMFRRFVFRDLPKGTYRIKDINDQAPNYPDSLLINSIYLDERVAIERGIFSNTFITAYAKN